MPHEHDIATIDRVTILEIIGIAVALAMDAFAVAVSSGATIRAGHLQHAFRLATWFGGFQAFMPLLGWVLGVGSRRAVGMYDHWVAFLLLSFVGIKMIVGSLGGQKTESIGTEATTRTVLMLAVATSIDALATGITFGVSGVLIVVPVVTIGVVTFAISFVGVLVGARVGHWFENRLEIAGGIILIAIGTRILVEHLCS